MNEGRRLAGANSLWTASKVAFASRVVDCDRDAPANDAPWASLGDVLGPCGAPDRVAVASNAPEPSLALPGWLVGGVGYLLEDGDGCELLLAGIDSPVAGRGCELADAGFSAGGTRAKCALRGELALGWAPWGPASAVGAPHAAFASTGEA